MSQLADGFKTVFNVVSVIAIVAVIIIMNTLVTSVTERIAEIGTMRAIGVHKGFVRHMIGAETVTLAFVFGGAGVAFALVLLSILGATGIRASRVPAHPVRGARFLGRRCRPARWCSRWSWWRRSPWSPACIRSRSHCASRRGRRWASTDAGPTPHRLSQRWQAEKRTLLLTRAIVLGVVVATLLTGSLAACPATVNHLARRPRLPHGRRPRPGVERPERAAAHAIGPVVTFGRRAAPNSASRSTAADSVSATASRAASTAASYFRDETAPSPTRSSHARR